MADNRIIYSIVEKCDFLYDDALISKELIIKKYLTFFAERFDPEERSVCFAFHTGSLCFDVVSVAALMIGCLIYDFSSNEEILAGLQIDQMVLYKNQRYRWGGVEKESSYSGERKSDFIILKQNPRGKKSELIRKVPYDSNKHLIKPYHGDSSVTDERGIRKEENLRNDFISNVLDISISDVPNTLDLSVVVVSDKNEFIEISKHLKIRYAGNKTVNLMDVVPVSYYTGSGEQQQIGRNSSKAEAVIKVTNMISIARDLVLANEGNRVIGLMVTKSDCVISEQSELNDLLSRKKLKFAHVIVPYSSDSCEFALEQYENAHIFACTKDFLSDSYNNGSCNEVKSANDLTDELNRQILNIVSRERDIVSLKGFWNFEQYRQINKKLCAIKDSDCHGDDRDDFIIWSKSLIKLFATAFFSMKSMNEVIETKAISSDIVSPKARIEKLIEIASNMCTMREQAEEIVAALMDVYSDLFDSSPKGDALVRVLNEYSDKNIAVVVPKAYYTELYTVIFHGEYSNAEFVTANKFDRQNQYDVVIAIGDITGKQFDVLQCFAAPKIIQLLYDFEEKIFSFRERKLAKLEHKLNARIKGRDDDYNQDVQSTELDAPEINEQTMREFSELDDFDDFIEDFDIRKFIVSGKSVDNSNTAEVNYVGTFTTGKHILFSKYYSAVVFNQNDGKVTEKSPEELDRGDIVVFTEMGDFTRNIVDLIFDDLMRTKKRYTAIHDAAEKVVYWKDALREYKEVNKLTYRALSNELKKFGSSLQEVTVRLWLIEESHIVGPRDLKTMKMIGEVTKDPYLLRNPEAYFDACRTIRRCRRKILSMIATAINNKLSNKQYHGSMFELIYKNIDKLSKIMELEDIRKLDNAVMPPYLRKLPTI